MRKIFMVFILAIALTLSGCYPAEKRVEKDNTSGTASGSTHLDGTHFEYSKNFLDVSFDLPEIPDELPSRIKLKEKTFDHKEVIDLFFGGEAPVSEYLYGVNKEHGQYTASDGAELNIAYNGIYYRSGKKTIMRGGELKAPVNYFDVLHLCSEYTRDRYSITEEDLEGFPLQDALDSVRDLISKLSIAGLSEPRIYSVSLASYKKIKQKEPHAFNEDYQLTKDNEIYVFEFPRLFGEVEALNLGNVSIKVQTNERGTMVGFPSLVVGVAKDGIFEFEIQGIYEADYEVLSTEPVKYDLDHAVSELEKYFDKVNFTRSKKVVINNAKVVYYPVERNEPWTVEFVPAWSFEGYYRNLDFESEVNHVDLIDYRLFVKSDVGVVMEYSEV